MTREHAKALLPIITAYAEGKTIEFRVANSWIEANPSWNESLEYRIAPEPDPYADLKAAKDAGKVIQLNFGTLKFQHWKTINPDWTANVENYRIKPEPRLVPMTSDDLPPSFWIRSKELNRGVWLCTACKDDGSFWSSNDFGIQPYQFEHFEWSPDRKTWHSFMKEIQP